MITFKFRAWDKINKKWLWPYPEGFDILGEVTVFDMLEQYKVEHFIERLNDLEITQYIGLKDKNGKKIYENDILNIGEKGCAKPCQVAFNEGCFCIIPEWNLKIYIPLKEYCNDIFINCVEIIGNIYENKNLLEELNDNKNK